MAFAGPYVVPFDGKESAVINSVLTVLKPYTSNVTVLSYTVGAPLADTPAAAPAATAGRRLAAAAPARCATRSGAINRIHVDFLRHYMVHWNYPLRRMHRSALNPAEVGRSALTPLHLAAVHDVRIHIVAVNDCPGVVHLFLECLPVRHPF